MNRKTTGIVLAVVFILSFLFADLTSATIGPVHVELNITGERLGASRANTANSFKIYMRYNKDINAGDRITIWFPIDEATCDQDKICGEPLVIKGFDENPRFVPNEKYFEAYKNDEEAGFSKLYDIYDFDGFQTKFYEYESCDNDGENGCRLVPDPSGLGSWIMGTVLPSIPKDDSLRSGYLWGLGESQKAMIGYCSCCCMPPLFTQTCDGKKNGTIFTLPIEEWRQGYNPIDINTSKSLGIISPATPGRYKLRVATEAEPTPVESDSFVLPCSQISNLKVDVNLKAKDKDEYIKIDFDVGEGGALDAGNSLITVTFPETATIPTWIANDSILVNDEKK
ncbi:MAG: hypothetical protein R2883_01505 [Caldisericia bacterium]